MSVNLILPASLCRLTGGSKKIECEAGNIAGLIKYLDEQFPGAAGALCDERGELQGFVNIFVNGQNVRYLQGMDTALREGDEVAVIPAIAGG